MGRWLPVFLALAALLPAGSVALGASQDDQRLRSLKRLQHDILLSGAARKLAAVQTLARRRRRAWAGVVSRPPRELAERGVPPRAGVAAGAEAARTGFLQPADVRVNDTSADVAGSTQSEVSLASLGPHLLAAWNDGENFQEQPSGIGYAYSSDHGRTWKDGGAMPRAGGVGLWVSDPVLAVDEKRSCFYLAGMVIAVGPRSGIAVVRGLVVDGALVWDTPRVARATRDTFPDKPWVAADSLTGNLYLSYTSFYRVQGRSSDQIEFQRSTDGGVTWTPAAKLSLGDQDGLVQGSRPAVGPAGELHVVWKTIDTSLVAAGRDRLEMRTSLDGGRSFGERVTAGELFTNFCSGPPGFNRGFGLGFPSIAVDRSDGPWRGRIHVAWEESLDFYDDPLGTEGPVLETEPDDDIGSAAPFEIGRVVRGRIDPAWDLDWLRFRGEQGRTVVLYLDSLSRELDVALRLTCHDRITRLAYSAPLTIRSRVLVLTLPVTGDYYVSMVPMSDSTGAYRLATGWAERGLERGRDHRDLFACHSDDGRSWSAPARVSDSPAGFDDWLPELAVAPGGKPYLTWYDWREGDPSGCGAASHVLLARSDDGGDTWSTVGPLTRLPTLWSAVASNLSPNLGDYHGLFADQRAVYAGWGDGRDGEPNAFFAGLPLPARAAGVAGLGGDPLPDGVRVSWSAPDLPPLAATAYRRAPGEDWQSLRTLRSDRLGLLALVDREVQEGWRYQYRLGVQTAEGEVLVGEVVVDVASGEPSRLAIERVRPNPSGGVFQIAFRRLGHGPARVELLDLGGRRVLERVVGEEYGTRGVVDLGAGAGLPAGLYLVRLSEAGQAVSAKVVVMR